MTSDAMIKAIKRIFDLLLSEPGPARPLGAQASPEMRRALWTHRQIGYAANNNYARSGEQ
jgi:hypothetical protein